MNVAGPDGPKTAAKKPCSVDGTDGVIRAIDPILGGSESRLVIELMLVGSSPS